MVAGFWTLLPARATPGIRPLILSRGAARIVSVHSIPLTITPQPKINHCLALSNERKSLLERPGLLGIKRGMITWFTESGELYGATVLEIDSCEVVSNTSVEKDGYSSVKLGHVDKLKNVSKFTRQICEEAGVTPKANFGEFRVRTNEGLIQPGVELTADYFAIGQLVDVKAVSKGKGFAGVMKRHGFKGLRATHGVSLAHRSAGSMGATQDPGRVLPGKKMAGRMGGRNCTTFNNEILHADGEAGILVVKGQVPGPKGCFVKIADAKKLYGQSLLSLKQ
ncbi:CIC11C00000002107 [Sungouiella intermedia]|uniref:Large ribosomal subunit protein uL3m n=1 Tax=Sungouiella intermedia TaxID=45354 RepID=A0A1L0BKX0_9ASCO|nr:CIC11C00000002107 [[Candida] intermedia]